MVIEACFHSSPVAGKVIYLPSVVKVFELTVTDCTLESNSEVVFTPNAIVALTSETVL